MIESAIELRANYPPHTPRWRDFQSYYLDWTPTWRLTIRLPFFIIVDIFTICVAKGALIPLQCGGTTVAGTSFNSLEETGRDIHAFRNWSAVLSFLAV